MLNKSIHTDSQLSWLANDAYLKALHIATPYLSLKEAIYLHFSPVRRHFHSKFKNHNQL